PGVRDNGGADNTGVATSFHCTNFSGVPETIRIVVRDSDGTLQANNSFAVVHLATLTARTHRTSLYPHALVTTGIVTGTAAIAATSINVICTAVTLDASLSVSPIGFALRGIRFNPAPGTPQ